MSRATKTYPSESRLVKAIKEALEREFGGFWFKVHGGAFQVTGIPDLLGCVQGHFCGLEVKLPGKEETLTDRQKHVIKLIVKAGGTAAMVTSKEEAVEVIRGSLYNDASRNKR